jgi:hypothetical protein
LLTRETVILREVVLLGRLGHLGFQVLVSGLVLFFDHVGRDVERNTMRQCMAQVGQMVEPLIEGRKVFLKFRRKRRAEAGLIL